MAEIQRAQDRLDEARATAQQDISLRQELKDEAHLPESQMQLAEIDLEQGRAAEAESLARMAADGFERQKMTDLGAQSYADLSRALLAQRKTKEAQSSAEHAMALSRHGGDLIAGFEAAFAAAAVDAESGKTTEAAKALEIVHDEASRHGYAAYELETRLRLEELELRSGKIGAARAKLNKVHKDAQAKGFFLIARKATAAARSGI
jgi:hypothetical protein